MYISIGRNRVYKTYVLDHRKILTSEDVE